MKKPISLALAIEVMASEVADDDAATDPALSEAALFRNGELEQERKLFHLDVSERGVAKAVTHLIYLSL